MLRYQYQSVDKSSGVGVIDKSVALLDALATSPCSLNELVAATGLPRPTAHRLALALEHHGLVARDADGRFILGPRIGEWSEPGSLLGVDAVVRHLRDQTQESAQVYRRSGDVRLCIAAAEPHSGLRDTVPIGARLTMQAGSAAQVLVAWLPAAERRALLVGAAFDDSELDLVRERGWAHSVGQREPGVASLAAPVRDAAGHVIAAVSISGPIERLARPSSSQRRAVRAAAQALSTAD